MNDRVVRRRLAAILDADVKGYTRHMRRDEDATLSAFRSHVSEVFDPQIRSHGGNIFKETGDGLLAEFDSVIQSLKCAIEIQRQMSERNATLLPDRRMSFRIGIDLGDIIHEGDDVFGEGVIVASRIEALAEPGGVCVSGSVYDQVRNKLPLSFVELSPQRVKNIDEPIRAYHVSTDANKHEGARGSTGLRRIHGSWVSLSVAAAALLLAAGLATWQLVPEWLVSKAMEITASAGDLPLPDRPSIAVLAFDNMSADAEQDYFIDGIAEDIITDLSKIPGLFVIARNSSFAYKGQSAGIRQIGRELGVRYILEGSIRRSGDTVRINAQLVDTQTEMHVWASRLDRKVDELFKVQDQISNEIVQALAVRLTNRENKAFARGTENIAAYDAFLRGWAKYRKGTRLSTTDALADFWKAIELDPAYGRAHAGLAATYVTLLERDWYDIGEKSDSFEYRMKRRARRDELQREARRHLDVAMAHPSPLALRASARLLSHQREYEKAIQNMVRAVSMDPNDADSYAQLGLTLTWAGRASEALDPIRKAIRLDPRYPRYVANLGIANFALEDYVKAAELLERSADANPTDHWPLIHLLSAYGYLGRQKEAAKTIGVLNRLLREGGHEEFTVKFTRSDMPYKYEADRLRLLVGLKRSGIPDFRGDFKVSPI